MKVNCLLELPKKEEETALRLANPINFEKVHVRRAWTKRDLTIT